ncbi:ABC transporter ATP-binding protein [Pusillimonas noertemannii]|uniref:Amino acid/amide ABC transporter ATP-binding protein 2 (HAAT family) n=1 Tax=Pusillimonas noertemannii TaxID=305977 RepID=A0A2U1CNS9_9BURK|nr:ABC transporter ATP-binding protein [Pusillimonas noertemannii]NYT68377.1 ABC transporter ATP-binding protein [Pusillimonas noertemannii]PVY62607.1 amino acid/amide ABC transporter ATP-binding protein 2 (HAAT family) [Pusillimonas noertemannii]TFL10447.1 ABC transporter ATP-binding protein [Pusillimonas noertemannii]
MTRNVLSIEQAATGYGKMEIVHGVSIEVREGGVTALVGGNGAGKTTLMLMLAGLLPVTAGRLRLDGADITQTRSDERVEAGIALVPEGRKIFPNLTVHENLRLGAVTARARHNWQERLAEMHTLFPRLQERRNQAAGTLSGGEQQMLAIARGLMSRPRVLLLDEPTLGLAPIMARHVFDTIRELNRSGLTILLAEQDTRSTLKVADFAHVIENGHVALSGPSQQLADNPRIRQAYLGL